MPGRAAVVAAQAQTVEWRVVENPYQEDVAYTVGATFNPGVVVEGVRWHSFTVTVPSDVFTEGETVDTEVTVVFENRRSKSAKVLAILLLEVADVLAMGARLGAIDDVVPEGRFEPDAEDDEVGCRLLALAGLVGVGQR